MQPDLISYKYSEAVLPPKFIICGVELKPFCLGHYILLEHINNPIILPEAVEMPLDDSLNWFFLALLVCSFSYEDAITLLNDPKELEAISQQFFNNLKRQMLEAEQWNFFEKMELFKEYLRYFMDMPIYTEEKGAGDEGIPSGTDWKLNIFLIFKKLGYTETQILNMNMKKLFFEWCSYAEAEGAIKVMNKYDLDALKKLKGK